MRKIKFKEWIPYEPINEGGVQRVKEGTARWSDDFTREGLFHQWITVGFQGEHNETHTVAIVELEDGTIEQVKYSHIKFIKEE